jgi:hypothetical protein
MQKLFIEAAPSLGEDAFIVKFSGVGISPWNDKPILTRKNTTTSQNYVFEYDIELSSGKKSRSFRILTNEGLSLQQGSMVKRVKLYSPKIDRKGLEFFWDRKLTEESQSLGLLEEYKKKPSKPGDDLLN